MNLIVQFFSTSQNTLFDLKRPKVKYNLQYIDECEEKRATILLSKNLYICMIHKDITVLKLKII